MKSLEQTAKMLANRQVSDDLGGGYGMPPSTKLVAQIYETTEEVCDKLVKKYYKKLLEEHYARYKKTL